MCQRPLPDRQPDFSLTTTTKILVEFWLDSSNANQLLYRFIQERWDDQTLVSVIKKQEKKLFFAHRKDDWNLWEVVNEEDDIAEVDVLNAWNKIITEIESTLLESEPL
jgi:hypothetical protein